MSSESFEAQVKNENFEYIGKIWKIYVSFKISCPKAVLCTVSSQYVRLKISER